jgi:hypothetical protein
MHFEFSPTLHVGLSKQICPPNANSFQQMFVGEVQQVTSLVTECQRRCTCGSLHWTVSNESIQGHVLCFTLTCSGCKFSRRWLSSSIMGTKYTVNARMVHGFTSSGLLAQQYRYFCDAAGIGRLSPFYIRESRYSYHCIWLLSYLDIMLLFCKLQCTTSTTTSTPYDR